MLLAGRTVVVFGYGWTGKGVALRAQGMGATVVVCEVDPMRALEARMDGCAVMPALEAAERGDVFITVTGGRDVLVGEHFERMKDGAMLANAGHFDVEIAVDQLAALATRRSQVLPLVEQFEIGDSVPPTRLNLLAQGRVVNLAAAEGHPAAVMDMSFASQALCVEHLALHGAALEPRVLPVPAEIDHEVARLKLASLGVRIDQLTVQQRAYLTSWQNS
jgi:adenosylhomocysteinase